MHVNVCMITAHVPFMSCANIIANLAYRISEADAKILFVSIVQVEPA